MTLEPLSADASASMLAASGSNVVAVTRNRLDQRPAVAQVHHHLDGLHDADRPTVVPERRGIHRVVPALDEAAGIDPRVQVDPSPLLRVDAVGRRLHRVGRAVHFDIVLRVPCADAKKPARGGLLTGVRRIGRWPTRAYANE
ncbi:hypothetical protein [Burkholderia puraquae]|uniref:hypothetical protein n=1 Tax=Burkholderia puraquae TaxID=1904757 RepID=UPI0010544F59|nr:hypothetical protein [Burkholderia puraquae]